MKISLTTFTLSLSLLIFPSEGSEEEKARPSGAARPKLSEIDKNGDKAITKEEAGPKLWERLGKLDKNGDGKVAGDEFRRSSSDSNRPEQARNGDFFKRLDKNSDGKITKDEAPQAWERLANADQDSDGSVSREEMVAAYKKRSGGTQTQQRGQLFARMDKNKDGELVADEVSKGWDRISKADKDANGSVSKKEWETAMAAYSKMRERGSQTKNRSSGGASSIFGKYDEDKNDKLDKEEVPEALWSKLSRADENADGLVSKMELESTYKKARDYSSKMKGEGADDKKPKRPSFE